MYIGGKGTQLELDMIQFVVARTVGSLSHNLNISITLAGIAYLIIKSEVYGFIG